MKNNSLLYGLTLFSLIIGLLYIGKSILLPFVFGFLLWIIITSWKKIFTYIKFFGKTIPGWLQTTFAVTSFIIGISLVGDLLANDFNNFSEVYPLIVEKINIKSTQIESLIGFNLSEYIQKNFQNINIANLARSAASSFSSAFGVIFTTLVYLMFIFGEQKMFNKKLKIASGKYHTKYNKHLSEILNSIKKYLSIKTGASILTGILSYFVMLAVGLEFPFVWAFLIFVLNFIPSIGSLIATFFPVAFALVSLDSWYKPLILLILIGAIQLYVGNILEPKYMGKQLNISPLLVIFSLFFWGALWGVPGMFLSVPLTVITMIILGHIPATKKIAIWMSGDGII